MTVAERALPSQPLAPLGAKTASGGKNAARRFALGNTARNPAGTLRKIRFCGGDRVRLPIFGNTIGSLVGDGISAKSSSSSSGFKVNQKLLDDFTAQVADQNANFKLAPVDLSASVAKADDAYYAAQRQAVVQDYLTSGSTPAGYQVITASQNFNSANNLTVDAAQTTFDAQGKPNGYISSSGHFAVNRLNGASNTYTESDLYQHGDFAGRIFSVGGKVTGYASSSDISFSIAKGITATYVDAPLPTVADNSASVTSYSNDVGYGGFPGTKADFQTFHSSMRMYQSATNQTTAGVAGLFAAPFAAYGAVYGAPVLVEGGGALAARWGTSALIGKGIVGGGLGVAQGYAVHTATGQSYSGVAATGDALGGAATAAFLNIPAPLLNYGVSSSASGAGSDLLQQGYGRVFGDKSNINIWQVGANAGLNTVTLGAYSVDWQRTQSAAPTNKPAAPGH
jgi:hypothetical protein